MRTKTPIFALTTASFFISTGCTEVGSPENTVIVVSGTGSGTDGDGGAGWSRSKRTVTVHSEYVRRFVRHGRLAAAGRDR